MAKVPREIFQDNSAFRGGTGFQPVNHGQDAHAISGSGFEPVHYGLDERDTSLHIRQGAYLPHWTRDHAIYSVTFRLADSLPQSVVEIWLAERENIVKNARQMNRSLSGEEQERLQYLFSEKVDNYMDRGNGACWMKRDEIAGIVADALRHFDGNRYLLGAWCVMPNHAHVILQPLSGHALSDILHSWKSFTANQANRVLKRQGEFWQPEYYDHQIRDENDLCHSIEYVLSNPEKAGLRNWKWVGGGTGFQPVNHGQDAHATSNEPITTHAGHIMPDSLQTREGKTI